MKIIFSIFISTLFYVSLFSQNEYRNTMIEECLSLHQKYFLLDDSVTTDTIFACTHSKYVIKHWANNFPFLINKHHIVLQSTKEISKRVHGASLYPVYYITLKKINKTKQIIYIATMSIKWRDCKLCFSNTEANSDYLIDDNHIKRITINGEIMYQE